MGLGCDGRELFVGNIPVNCGKMQGFSVWIIFVPSCANRLRRPGFLQLADNVIPFRRILFQGSTGIGSAPLNGKAFSTPGMIPVGTVVCFLGFRSIPPDLPADRRRASSQG